MNTIKSIPEPNHDDPKEVYAFFGLAAYKAQCFEQSVILLIAALKGKFIGFQHKNFDEIFLMLDKMPLGRLKSILKEIEIVDGEVAITISNILPKRNYLMHHFFVTHAEDNISEVGRKNPLMN